MIAAVLGAVTAMLLFFFVAKLAARPSNRPNLGRSVYDVGGAKLLSSEITQHGPLLFQALVGDRDIYVQHLGRDTAAGWLSFDAHANGAARRCVLQWQPASRTFTDPCSQQTYPEDGAGLTTHPVIVQKGRVSVDLRGQ
ncbi:MAG: hypothetical protein QOG64_1971 [Acidimicrobiaceae bacterium]|nr:hypothetical protein [Acidimicrobiaceae bacterium]